MRQLIVTGLGHESPTFFLTNDRLQPQTAREVIQDLRHPESRGESTCVNRSRSSTSIRFCVAVVRSNVDFPDLTLTVLADLLYRNLADRLKGFAQAGPSTLFLKFVDAPGVIEITAGAVAAR